jgi:pyruvate/2-oxoglutarate dehydrogenase complex dihydrolipoamide dehydrogenase (E3) component
VIDVDPGQAVPLAGLYADGCTGRTRMVVDDDRGYLLGVTFVGPGMEELIHSATIARSRPSPYQLALRRRLLLPSISEVWLRLLEAYRA